MCVCVYLRNGSYGANPRFRSSLRICKPAQNGQKQTTQQSLHALPYFNLTDEKKDERNASKILLEFSNSIELSFDTPTRHSVQNSMIQLIHQFFSPMNRENNANSSTQTNLR